MKKFYHATEFKNLGSIISTGILAKGIEKCVFLCEKPDEAARFVAIRSVKDIAVFEVELNEILVKESFDHSEEFFKCKAFTYGRDIKADEITNIIRYELGK